MSDNSRIPSVTTSNTEITENTVSVMGLVDLLVHFKEAGVESTHG